MHLFNVKSADATLSQRSKNLYDLNIRFLTQTNSKNKCSGRAIQALRSIEYDHAEHVSTQIDTGEVSLYVSRGESTNPIFPHGIGTSAETQDILNVPEVLSNTEEIFDWFQLPLDDELIFDNVFEGPLWEGR